MQVKPQKGEAPYQANRNKVECFSLPVSFQSIQKLEKVLIEKSPPYKKVTIMPSCQMLKIFETICNALIDAVEVIGKFM